MADFGNCIEWVLRLEDRTLSGKTVVLADGAGRTRFGIAEKDHPNLPADFYTCDTDKALEMTKDIYWETYWKHLCGQSLPTDELAATLLSFAVNDGPGTGANEAVKLLQGLLDMGITPDGVMGGFTLAAIAKLDPAQLAEDLREAQANFYREVVMRNPAKTVFLNGWLNRAEAVYPNLPA